MDEFAPNAFYKNHRLALPVDRIQFLTFWAGPVARHDSAEIGITTGLAMGWIYLKDFRSSRFAYKLVGAILINWFACNDAVARKHYIERWVTEFFKIESHNKSRITGRLPRVVN